MCSMAFICVRSRKKLRVPGFAEILESGSEECLADPSCTDVRDVRDVRSSGWLGFAAR